jgi:hypothetical protein
LIAVQERRTPDVSGNVEEEIGATGFSTGKVITGEAECALSCNINQADQVELADLAQFSSDDTNRRRVTHFHEHSVS